MVTAIQTAAGLLSLPLEIGDRVTAPATAIVCCCTRNVNVFAVSNGELVKTKKRIWCCSGKNSNNVRAWKMYYEILVGKYGKRCAKNAFRKVAPLINLTSDKLPLLTEDDQKELHIAAQHENEKLAQKAINKFLQQRQVSSMPAGSEQGSEPINVESVNVVKEVTTKVTAFISSLFSADSGAGVGSSQYVREPKPEVRDSPRFVAAQQAKLKFYSGHADFYKTVRSITLTGNIDKEKINQMVLSTFKQLEHEGYKIAFVKKTVLEETVMNRSFLFWWLEQKGIDSLEQAKSMFEAGDLTEDDYFYLLESSRFFYPKKYLVTPKTKES